MDIKVKDGECWGTVYVVLFKIDGIDSVRVFTTIDKAQEFSQIIKGSIFTQTLDKNE